MTDPTMQSPAMPSVHGAEEITLSFSEIDAMAKKAARGAGYSWGMAEEAGKATRWLAVHGLPGPEKLAALLTETLGVIDDVADVAECDGIWRTPDGRMCPLTAGAQVSDRRNVLCDGVEIHVAHALHPLLAVPFLARIAAYSDVALDVDFGSGSVAVWPQGLSAEDLDTFSRFDAASLRISISSIAPGAVMSAHRHGYKTPVAAWKTLDAFAGKTYVPASEASRQRGAG